MSEVEPREVSAVQRLYEIAANWEQRGIGVLRLGLILVLLWIGGLKWANYEAEGIVPFVANSPIMSFFYHYPAPEYSQHMNQSGGVVPANEKWHEENGTYRFSKGVGCVIVGIGLLIALHPIRPQVAAVGSFLLVLMTVTTLSFLATTPEAWVPNLGSPTHGFPYLNLPGLLVVKDAIMFGAAIVTMGDSARAYLRRIGQRS